MATHREPGWAEALAGRTGRDYWRGLDELLETPAFREAAMREFPAGAAERSTGLTRRALFTLVGSSLALAGLSGCLQPPTEQILPYVEQPPDVVPGIPSFYATSMVVGGYATGLLAESHVGRPTRVQGNPLHPASLGASGVYEQASVIQLYDPQRARSLTHRGAPASFGAFVAAFGPAAPGAPATFTDQGARLRFLLEPTGSPLVAAMLGRVRERYPRAKVHVFGPLASHAGLEGARLAFRRPLVPQLDLLEAAVVLSLDADFLAGMPFHLRYSRHFAERRRVLEPSGEMNRLYVAEAPLTVTGATADHRLAVRSRQVQDVAAAVLGEVVGQGRRPPGMPDALLPALARLREAAPERAWVRAVARDLLRHAGSSLVIAGERQPPLVHTTAHLLNAALGNAGRTVRYNEPALLGDDRETESLAALVDAMRAGEVETLVILEGNPSYTAPADVEFSRWLRTVPRSVYLNLYRNETSRDCTWFVPGAHYLEAWADARAFDGTVSLVQPLIEPLFGGRTPAEVLAVFAGEGGGAHRLLRDFHRARYQGDDFERYWETILARGLIEGSAFAPVATALAWDRLASAVTGAEVPSAPAHPFELEANFLQDPSVYDGRFTNNGWLLELPDPMTKLTWDNAALLSPRTAVRLGIESEQMVRLRYRGRTIDMPVLVLPGHADDAVSLHFGYGREGDEERVARHVGFDVYRIWPSDASPYFGPGLHLEPLVGPRLPGLPIQGQTAPIRYPLALTQEHWPMHGRPLVLSATFDEYRENPDFTKPLSGPVPSLYTPFRYAGDQWGMAIDLTVCTGCSACVIACQAENNIPIVGKAGVLARREMHWLRIDRYYTGPPDNPAVVVQPMLCQHCEQAPCEYVCPVNATVHSPDGLNEMIYNRCVGTRFCSNNCPYKVRRFNWFDYNGDKGALEKMPMNPDVTVRARGVMEKCTYCVQRIRTAEIAARVEGRRLEDGEFTTACAEACPTRAIVFGNVNEPESAVSRLRRQKLSYSVLHDLGTEPRTRYLARIVNPNPDLA